MGLSIRHPKLELQLLFMSVLLMSVSSPVPVRCRQVRRLVSCDGLLACHAIQGCLCQHVKACAAAATGRYASNKFVEELEDWLRVMVDAIVESLSQGEYYYGGT